MLPNSYSYRRGETRAAVLARMQAAMRRELARLWARRRPASAVATPREAIILASIVEKETGKPAERRLVAGVYSNRLRRGMPLQADPTVIYPVTRGRPLGRRILQSELAPTTATTPMRRAGLPAGPIANPGRASIAAVLDPAPTAALYFVADGTRRPRLRRHARRAPGQCRALVRDPPRPRRDVIGLAQPALLVGAIGQPDEQDRDQVDEQRHDRAFRRAAPVLST